MQELFEIGFACEDDYNSLKKLWIDTFGDSVEVVNNFFEYTAQDENIICAKYNSEIVSALYIVDSVVENKGKKYKSMYIYAVATHEDFRRKGIMKKLFSFLFIVAKNRGVSYLFLVPENGSLFEMYKKQGFETCFYYKERYVLKSDYSSFEKAEISELTYGDYDNLREKYKVTPLATLSENGFESFYKPVSDEVKVIYIKNAGYCVAEYSDSGVLIYELFGDENIILPVVFKLTQSEKLTVREYSKLGGVPFGMAKIIDNSPEILNGFFGIPYGG